MSHRLSRRQVVQGAGAMGFGLLAGCGRLPGPAQPPARVPRIGFLVGARQSGQEEFSKGLSEFGYVEGQNVTVEYRSADGRLERLPELVAELIGLPVDIIVVGGEPSTRAAANATKTIPILMYLPDDPVASGLVPSLARPGGNLTGVTNIVSKTAGKRLQLLKEVVPQVSHVAILRDPSLPGNMLESSELEEAGRALALQVQFVDIRDPNEVEGALEGLTRESVDSLMALSNTAGVSQGSRIVELANRASLPAMYPFRQFADMGGLMAYAPSPSGQYHRLGYYVDRILKGTKPADLPIEQPMRFEFVINLRTAQALGVAIPPHVLLQATEVIQ